MSQVSYSAIYNCPLSSHIKGLWYYDISRTAGCIDIIDNYGEDDIKIIQEVFLDGTGDEAFFSTEQTRIVQM